MEAWGLKLLCKEERWRSDSLSVIAVPPNIDSADIVTYAYAKHNLTLGVGLGQARPTRHCRHARLLLRLRKSCLACFNLTFLGSHSTAFSASAAAEQDCMLEPYSMQLGPEHSLQLTNGSNTHDLATTDPSQGACVIDVACAPGETH